MDPGPKDRFYLGDKNLRMVAEHPIPSQTQVRIVLRAKGKIGQSFVPAYVQSPYSNRIFQALSGQLGVGVLFV
jgi:hypothetical protein